MSDIRLLDVECKMCEGRVIEYSHIPYIPAVAPDIIDLAHGILRPKETWWLMGIRAISVG